MCHLWFLSLVWQPAVVVDMASHTHSHTKPSNANPAFGSGAGNGVSSTSTAAATQRLGRRPQLEPLLRTTPLLSHAQHQHQQQQHNHLPLPSRHITDTADDLSPVKSMESMLRASQTSIFNVLKPLEVPFARTYPSPAAMLPVFHFPSYTPSYAFLKPPTLNRRTHT
eukprot:m.336986 g.336986  ORF g.336986 m.336986 type:complete len:167 (+) comp16079_c0_seq1:5540-6040(+)